MPSTESNDPEPGSPRPPPEEFCREFAAKLRGTPTICPDLADTPSALNRENVIAAALPGPSRSHF